MPLSPCFRSACLSRSPLHPRTYRSLSQRSRGAPPYHVFLIERKILPTPLLYLSAFFEAARRDYYDGLRGVSQQGAWHEWLEYFLQGVARMSEDALNRATHMNDLLAQWQDMLAGHSTNTPLRVLGLLAANPFVTITGAADQLKLAFTTAQRAIDRLEQNGIVQQVSDAKRDRVYCAQAPLDILKEPAHLKPRSRASG